MKENSRTTLSVERVLRVFFNNSARSNFKKQSHLFERSNFPISASHHFREYYDVDVLGKKWTEPSPNSPFAPPGVESVNLVVVHAVDGTGVIANVLSANAETGSIVRPSGTFSQFEPSTAFRAE